MIGKTDRFAYWRARNFRLATKGSTAPPQRQTPIGLQCFELCARQTRRKCKNPSSEKGTLIWSEKRDRFAVLACQKPSLGNERFVSPASTSDPISGYNVLNCVGVRRVESSRVPALREEASFDRKNKIDLQCKRARNLRLAAEGSSTPPQRQTPIGLQRFELCVRQTLRKFKNPSSEKEGLI